MATTRIERLRQGFRDRLAQRMREVQVSQTAMAEACDISQSSISDYLNRGAIPNAEVLMLMAPFLKCSADWLLFGTRSGGEGGSAARAYHDGGLAMIARLRRDLEAAEKDWQGETPKG